MGRSRPPSLRKLPERLRAARSTPLTQSQWQTRRSGNSKTRCRKAALWAGLHSFAYTPLASFAVVYTHPKGIESAEVIILTACYRPFPISQSRCPLMHGCSESGRLALQTFRPSVGEPGHFISRGRPSKRRLDARFGSSPSIEDRFPSEAERQWPASAALARAAALCPGWRKLIALAKVSYAFA